MGSLPVNAFDVILLVVLGAGLARGRKNGMSQELLLLLKWLTVLFVCAVAYEPIASLFGQSTTMFSTLACYLMAYIGAGLVIILLFAAVNRALGGKLLGSDLFGPAEYYLGMGSGLIRFAAILLVVLAVLNARYFSPQDVKAEEAYQDEWYGSHYFPTLHSIQTTVFEESYSGRWIKDNLSFLLIKPTHSEGAELHQKDAKW
jgi:uncharacterized membrane protein required for colicin V production